jgi:hypothetical protein
MQAISKSCLTDDAFSDNQLSPKPIYHSAIPLEDPLKKRGAGAEQTD